MAEPTLESMKGMEDHVPGERDSRDALTRELEWDPLQEVRSGQARRAEQGPFPGGGLSNRPGATCRDRCRGRPPGSRHHLGQASSTPTTCL